MESPTCGQCTRMTYDLCLARSQMQQQYEELCILRKAQRECADMASEIQALHVCVEEQRRHLQAQSSKPKDPGVGIYSWMDVVSKQHVQREAELRASYELQVQAMQVLQQTSVAQVSYLTEQVATLTASLQEAQEAAAVSAKDLEMAYRCIVEQRRHIYSVSTDGVSADADVGLVPLLRAGAVVLGDVKETPVTPVPLHVEELERARMCMILAIDAADAEVATLREALEKEKRTSEGIQAELSACRQQVLVAKTEFEKDAAAMTKLAFENAHLTSQVELLKGAVAEMQAAQTSVEELERAQRGFEALASANETLQVDVARLTKERDATVKGIRHWQAEAQKITADLVSALESRDRFQAEQFSALKQCRQLTGRVTELERQVADMFKFYQLGQQVFGLVQVVDRAIVGESQQMLGSAAEEACAATCGAADGVKKAKSKKKKNKA